MAHNFSKIQYKKTNNVAEIVLNDPPLNIITLAMMQEINSVLTELVDDEKLHLLIFKANGKHFSVGADVAEHTREKCPEMIPEFMNIFYNLNRISCPTIAVVQGMALGGGCELVVFCDMVLASEKAKFGQPEISVGVFPPVAAVIFPILCGRNRAFELLLSGNTISAVEAEKIGLINKVYPEDQFQEKVKEFLLKLTNKSSSVLKLSKRTIDRGLNMSVIEALADAEKTYLQELMESFDANEGIQAFLEKRSPVWKGN